MSFSEKEHQIIKALDKRFAFLHSQIGSEADIEDLRDLDIPKTLIQRGKANWEATIVAIGNQNEEGKPLEELTKEDKLKIKRYTGWGGFGIQDATTSNPKTTINYWAQRIAEDTGLDLLNTSTDGIDPLRAVRNEYYTPYWLTYGIAKKIKPLMKHFKKNDDGKFNAVETSSGVGRFLQPFSPSKFDFHAVEPSNLAYQLLSRAYPQAKTYNAFFEEFITDKASGQKLQGNTSLVVTNPPYGNDRDPTLMQQDSPFSKISNQVDYFLLRSMSLLHNNGVGAFVVTSGFMTSDKQKKARQEFLRSNHILGAIRLPSDQVTKRTNGKPTATKPAIFEGTKIIIDVIFAQRRKGRLKAIKRRRDKDIIDGQYFALNPDHVVGKEETIKSQYGEQKTLTTDVTIDSLPDITFVSKGKEGKDSAYTTFKIYEGSEQRIIIKKGDRSALDENVKSALQFTEYATDFLVLLASEDYVGAAKIQGEVLDSLKIFEKVYPRESQIRELKKALSDFDKGTAMLFDRAYSSRSLIKKKVDVSLSIPKSAYKNPVTLAIQLLKIKGLRKEKLYLDELDKIFHQGKGGAQPVVLQALIDAKRNDGGCRFAFVGTGIKSTNRVQILDGDTFFVGLLWGKYDKINKELGALNAFDDFNFSKIKNNPIAGRLKSYYEGRQKPELEKNLGMVTSAYLLSYDKTSARDAWIDAKFIDIFFKEKFFYEIPSARSSSKNKFFDADEFDVVRQNKRYYLKTQARIVFRKQYEDFFLTAKFMYFEKIFYLVEDKYPDTQLYRDMKTAYDTYLSIPAKIKLTEIVEEVETEGEEDTGINENPIVNPEEEEIQASSKSKMVKNPALKEEREKISKRTINYYSQLRKLIKQDDKLSKKQYEEFYEFYIPVTSLKVGELFDPQRVFLGYVAIAKTQFNPRYVETQRAIDNNENTKLSVQEDTDAARLRLIEEYQTKWNMWLSANPDILEAITDAYNRNFKGYKVPALDGTPISILGYRGLPLRPYQNAGVRKLTIDNGGLLAFDVGLGKTFTGICTIGLMKQNGKAKRPVVVVPKSLIWQWYKNIGICFPTWNIAVVGETKRVMKNGRIVYGTDTPSQRGEKYVGLKLGLYDCLIVPYEKLKTSPLSQETFKAYVDKIFDMRLKSVDPNADDSKMKAQLKDKDEFRAKIQKSIALGNERADEGILWEDVGVDLIMVDEAQNFKNLHFPDTDTSASIKYLGIAPASKRAYHLDIRCIDVRKRGGAICLLSATPAKNSPIEFYNMIQYINPDAYSGVESATQYMQRYIKVLRKRLPTTNLGSDVLPYVAGFDNLDEFRDIIARYAMFETLDTIKEKYGKDYPDLMESLKIPHIWNKEDEEGFTPYILLDPKSDQDKELEEIIKAGDPEKAPNTKYWSLIEKRNKLARKRDPEAEAQDKLIALEVILRLNAVAIHPALNKIDISDGEAKVSKSNRKEQALDVVRELEINGKLEYPKFTRCAKNVLSASGENGCGHIIFVENILAHYIMKRVLVKYGIDEDRIALMNGLETSKSQERTDVQNKFNGNAEEGIDPEFDIVIANSIAYEGIDLQARTCMIHHLDLGWEAATIQQRNGRGVRQGNRFSIIKIYYYIIKGSSDSIKLTMIQQKRNWLIDAVKSQDVASNNPLADDLSIDNFLLQTLRDPEALEAEMKERAFWSKFQAKMDLAQKRAFTMTAIRSAYKMAQFSLDSGNIKRQTEQLAYADSLLHKFKKETPLKEYPFAGLVEMLRTNDLYVVPNSPIGGVIIEGMIWSVKSMGDIEPFYAYASHSSERKSKVKIQKYTEGLNQNYSLSTIDGSDTNIKILIVSSTEENRYLRKTIGVDDTTLAKIDKKYSQQAIYEALIEKRLLNLDQLQTGDQQDNSFDLVYRTHNDLSKDGFYFDSNVFYTGRNVAGVRATPLGRLYYYTQSYKSGKESLYGVSIKKAFESSYRNMILSKLLAPQGRRRITSEWEKVAPMLFKQSSYIFQILADIPSSMEDSLMKDSINLYGIVALRLFLYQSTLNLRKHQYIPFIDESDDKLYFIKGKDKQNTLDTIPYFGANVKSNLNIKNENISLIKFKDEKGSPKFPLRKYTLNQDQTIDLYLRLITMNFDMKKSIDQYKIGLKVKKVGNAYIISSSNKVGGSDKYSIQERMIRPRIIKIIPMERRGIKVFSQYLNQDKFGGIISVQSLGFPFQVSKTDKSAHRTVLNSLINSNFVTGNPLDIYRTELETATEWISKNYFRQVLSYKLRLRLREINIPNEIIDDEEE